MLLGRHQAWIFNLALRMLQVRSDAEDATQEVLLKLATRLDSFAEKSRFKTWAYRVAANHLLDRRRSKAEESVHDFECYGRYLDNAPDAPLSQGAPSPEESLLVEEARTSCMMGMLLCLDRRQRMVFLLGEIFEVEDVVGAEVLEISRENFRQQLCRAREQLYGFMAGKCGLANPANPCRCARKTRAFIDDGIVDPNRLQFTEPHLQRVRDLSSKRGKMLEAAVEAGQAALYREHPFLQPPDIAERLRELVETKGLRALLEVAGV